MVKTLRKSSSPEPRNLESWNLVYYICVPRPTKFVSNDNPMLTFDLSTKMVSLTLLCIYIGKILKSQFFKDCWRLIYYIWHTYLLTKNMKIFQCQGQWMTFDLCFKVPVNSLFQTTSALKPESHLWPYFIFNLLGLGEQKLIQMVTVCWPRWSPCPYMVKTLGKFSPEPRNRKPWNFV